jgi:hypothetical protein
VIARWWVCTEQPLPLWVAALPLHPLVLLLALALAAWWMLIGRVSAARLVFLAVGASTALLAASTLLFAGVGTALFALGQNPTYALRFAPWWWGLGGALLIGAAVRYVRKVGLQAVRERLAVPELRASHGCVWLLVLVAAVVPSIAIVVRYFVSDEEANVAAVPYRLLEWGIIDRLDGPVSDECLANRVLEYGNYNSIGEDASAALYSRKGSAVAGVTARLDELAEHWPPKPHTVTGAGIAALVNFSERYGQRETVERWKKIPYERDLQSIEPSSGSFF